MAKVRQLGHNMKLKIDGAYVGNLINFTPPGASRSEVDTTILEDTIEQFLDTDPPKIDNGSATCQWDPSDTGDAAIDTLFHETDPDDREVEWIIEMPRIAKKITFNARILKLGPQQIAQKTVVTRQIDFRPTTKPVVAALV